jgi:hypothetical protein
LSIDRIDNNSGYNPNNCRWATNTTQQSNIRSSVFSEHQISLIKEMKSKGNTIEEISNMLSISDKKAIGNHYYKKDAVSNEIDKIQDYRIELDNLIS